MRAAWRLSAVAIVLASAVGAAPRVPLADLATLRVRDTTLTLDARRGVAMVEAAPLARLMGGTWTREADGRYVLAVGTVRATLIAGLPYARTANTAHALVVAPQLRGAALWIPLQVVTELIPRLDPTFGFDRARGELRLPPRAAAIVATPPARPAPSPAATPVKRVTSRRVIDPIYHGSGGFKHAQTFSHSPAMCAAGLAAVRHIRAHDLVGRAARMGDVLHARLASL